MTFSYIAYGLTIDSEICLPELLPGGSPPADVIIRLGPVPQSLPDAKKMGVTWQSAPGRLLQVVAGVGRYLIAGRKEIWIQAEPGASEDSIRVFLLGAALGALLNEWHILTMHSSVIPTERGAVLFMGPSGSGKSTLLARLLQNGYAMLADDKAGIKIDSNGVAHVLPGFPLVRLTSSAVEQLNFPTHAAEIKPALQKYALPVEKFCTSTLPLRAAYALRVHNRPDIHIEHLDGVRKFSVLCTSLYRPAFVRAAEQRKAAFAALGTAFAQAHVAVVKRPAHPFLLDELASSIEKDLAETAAQVTI